LRRSRSIEVEVDRHQVGVSLILDAVAGVVDEADARRFHLVGKLVHRLRHLPRVGVIGLDHVVAEALHDLGDALGIAARVAELRRVSVIVVADDQGDAVAGARPTAEKADDHPERREDEQREALHGGHLHDPQTAARYSRGGTCDKAAPCSPGLAGCSRLEGTLANV
jgi:hypothetical protein